MRSAALLPALLIGFAACGESGTPPAFSVGGVGFSSIDIELLGDEQRQSLADLTGFALAVAQERTDSLGAPFVERETRALLLQKLATELATRSTGLSDSAVERMYLEQPEPELVVRHLVILSERWRPAEARDSARRRAEAALRRIRSGEDFARVAAEVSDEPGAAERGGLLRPGREGSWVREFWQAAQALPVGGVSGVVETEYGYHVVRLEERRIVPFEEAREAFLATLELGAGLEGARDVADSLGAQVRTDTLAIGEWRAGGGDGDVVLARWPGGEYTGAEWGLYLASLDPESHARVESAGPDAYRRVVRSAASNDRLVDRARELGLRLSVPQRASVEGQWRQRVDRWIVSLGFRADADEDGIAQAALTALGEPGQGAQIARAELREIRPALRRLYSVTIREAAPAQ